MTATTPRAVLVTGASKGIGEACALHLHARGWKVYAGVRNDADGARLQAASGQRLMPVRLDVTSEVDIAETARIIARDTGDAGLHGLVNNAGIVVAGPLEFLPPAELRRQFDVNVVGQIAITQALLPALRKARGRIAFMGSISGRSALPFTGAYAASKHALEALGDALRIELRPFGLHVAIIEPGAIRTPIWQTSTAAAERHLANAPPELDEWYGRRLAGIRRHVLRTGVGLPPEVVARAVEHALTAARPRTRYVIGTDARIRLLLQRLLPDRARDAIISRRIDRL